MSNSNELETLVRDFVIVDEDVALRGKDLGEVRWDESSRYDAGGGGFFLFFYPNMVGNSTMGVEGYSKRRSQGHIV